MSRVNATKPLQKLRQQAYEEVKDEAAPKVAELILDDVSLSTIKSRWNDFKTALQNASTPAEIEQVKQNALERIRSV